MPENEKTTYDILWYLNEYPNEINATDDVIRSSLNIDRYDYQTSKDGLLKSGYIE